MVFDGKRSIDMPPPDSACQKMQSVTLKMNPLKMSYHWRVNE